MARAVIIRTAASFFVLCLVLAVMVLTASLHPAQPARAALLQDESEQPEDDVLAYIAANPDHVGIACYALDSPAVGVYHNADQQFMLASAYKILIAIAYAEQVAAGQLDPETRVPVEDLDAYYLPGTDGYAHSTWLQHTPVGADSTVSLRDVAHGMMRFSSNADSDYLLARVNASGYDWDDLFARLGTETLTEPQPTLGLFLMLNNPTTGLAEPDVMTDDEHHNHAERLMRRYLRDHDWREEAQNMQSNLRTLAVQPLYFGRFGPSASPADMARVMHIVYQGGAHNEDEPILSEAALEIIHDLLEWPLRDFPSLEGHFERLGVKGGSLPGILTAAYYGRSVDGQPMVLTVFYRNLDFAHYLSWSRSGAMQILELEAFKTHCGVFDSVLPQS